LASEKVAVVNYKPYSPDVNTYYFKMSHRLKEMLSSTRSLDSAIYQLLRRIPKRRLLFSFLKLDRVITKMHFSRKGTL
jgi:hypothetical protein